MIIDELFIHINAISLAFNELVTPEFKNACKIILRPLSSLKNGKEKYPDGAIVYPQSDDSNMYIYIPTKISLEDTVELYLRALSLILTHGVNRPEESSKEWEKEYPKLRAKCDELLRDELRVWESQKDSDSKWLHKFIEIGDEFSSIFKEGAELLKRLGRRKGGER